MRNIFKRPSAAMVVALIALIAALNGQAIANETATIAKAISGSKIKKHSIAGNRLKNNTVTGTQVKESSLGTVPSATNALHATSADNATHAGAADNATHAGAADNATHATNADNATHAASADATNGVKLEKIFYTTTAVDTNPTVIFHDGGLKLTATCEAASGGTTTVVASPDADNNEIDGSVTAGTTTNGFEDFNFDAAETQDIEDLGNTTGYDASGYLTFATQAGSVVSIVYQFDSNNSFGSSGGPHKACDFTGIAQVG